MGARQGSSFVVLAIVAVWLILFFSGRGVLVAGNDDGKILRCSYFAATSFVQREYYYSENGLMGKSNCPRIAIVTSE